MYLLLILFLAILFHPLREHLQIDAIPRVRTLRSPKNTGGLHANVPNLGEVLVEDLEIFILLRGELVVGHIVLFVCLNMVIRRQTVVKTIVASESHR